MGLVSQGAGGPAVAKSEGRPALLFLFLFFQPLGRCVPVENKRKLHSLREEFQRLREAFQQLREQFQRLRDESQRLREKFQRPIQPPRRANP
jgi:hypothetical protein